MWLLKLQYEFYNAEFYDAKRNFNHQSQRQEWKQKAAPRWQVSVITKNLS